MGTTHDAEELGMCSHGLACQAGAWGRYMGFCLRYGHIWENLKKYLPAKIFCEAHTGLAHTYVPNLFLFTFSTKFSSIAHRAELRGTCIRIHTKFSTLAAPLAANSSIHTKFSTSG